MESVENTAPLALCGWLRPESAADEPRAELAHARSSGNGSPPVRAAGEDARPLAGLFADQAIIDGAGMIALDVTMLVPHEDKVLISVRVDWSLVVAKAVVRLYLIADRNRQPLLALMSLIPDLVPPHVSVAVRLEHSGEVRAVVECGDGTLLQVKRWVEVLPPPGALT